MADVITIFHFLGLGDHIICNGLVRNLIIPEKKYRLVVKRNNLNSVKYMYRDLNNLDFYILNEDVEPRFFIENYKRPKIFIDFNKHHNLLMDGMPFDEAFYHQMQIDFDKRWTDFYVLRDVNKELELYSKLNPNNEPFAFVHGRGSDNVYRINNELINPELKIIEPINSETIFDYIHLILNAKEIHCVDSSFLHLVESLKFDNIKLFFHFGYKQRSPDFIKHTLKKNWIKC